MRQVVVVLVSLRVNWPFVGSDLYPPASLYHYDMNIWSNPPASALNRQLPFPARVAKAFQQSIC